MTAPLCDERSSEGYTVDGLRSLINERLCAAHLSGMDREGFPASSLKFINQYIDKLASPSPQLSSLSLEGEREAFEAWALAEGWNFIPGRDTYPSLSLKSAWLAWQARAAMKPQS